MQLLGVDDEEDEEEDEDGFKTPNGSDQTKKRGR